ncbi:MAG: glycoside hydrolase family 25 protein [Erythrobacter sp.]|uniref:glycoside hydrolase family 25 protein n=1 Tax=Erythrobacter sp. TaxID=1042 RepID=UPI003C73DF5C
MAPKRKRTRTRGARFWLTRALALAALAAIGFASWLWWDMRDWKPDAAAFPEQGVAIASGASPIRFETLRATGARFAYLGLADASVPPDPGFASRLERARAAGLEVGVIQPFDPCLQADPQSARFTRMVPRDSGLLPPAIALSATGEDCNPRVSDAAVESELTTFINQIELHAGKPAILKLTDSFEDRHGTARTTARDLWLMRDRAQPDYAGRPWLLWSANSQLVSEASREPVEWVVVQN